MTNKAIYVQPGGGFDRVTLGTCESMAPEVGEITVRIRASSLNYHDYAVVSGMWPPAVPRIPMSDGAGEVVAVGEGVNEFAIGDHVVSTFFPGWQEGQPEIDDMGTVPGDGVDGFACQQVTMAAIGFTHAPKGYSHAEAATLTCAGLTAWRALMVDGPLKPGETVLIQGTGGVSVFALQFAKVAGATVIATSSSDEKLARLETLGADHLINYRQHENWGGLVRELTAGRGVDHVIEVGGPATLAQSMVAARIGGHIAVVGILSGMTGTLPLLSVLTRQLRLQGLVVGSRRHQIEMIRAIQATGLRPIIDRHFPLEELVEAFRYQETNRHFGKICLDI
ncbi:NADPH:quinone reductase-like Zn-dependent oxidoreductase [Nitrosospira multiformis]|uniref:NADPH:quinone reductase-like Zn-dependent oxidoreductase n=1 Tax=Nitrosospira multiformis TaxID=1231 RepID=A0A2T5I576_9PROT|nr:NAD(P)-dependent alcohol dehydrogenase [Nitrosospira multiformis]PTQ78989.1 NADPH:quinone reductase-like Zn-dependent oxidoreductase [Nitrosospira multiformis]